MSASGAASNWVGISSRSWIEYSGQHHSIFRRPISFFNASLHLLPQASADLAECGPPHWPIKLRHESNGRSSEIHSVVLTIGMGHSLPKEVTLCYINTRN